MGKTHLNITNGDALTTKLKALHYEGEYLVWREMLCEGATSEFIGSERYFQQRKQFFSEEYDLIFDDKEFNLDLQKLDDKNRYTHIVLWFEYDLFCHINMIAVITLLLQRNVKIPVYLVCSGFTKKEHTLLGLSELSDKQLKAHYKNKVVLTEDDLQLAYTLWKIYCGKDHNLFKSHITHKSSFEYMGSVLKAHLKRFPDSQSGLSVLEKNILDIITKNNITSTHHLLGYILNYQGYYGYGDIQLKRIISNLEKFYLIKDDKLKLNELGKKALNKEVNCSAIVSDNIEYGGVNKLDYQFSIEENKLITPKFDVPFSF